MPGGVVIVGAGLAGSRCAETLRAEGFAGGITLAGEESDLPYERPALSKEFLAGTRAGLELQPASHFADREIRLALGTRVEQIDLGARLAHTPAGDLAWDALVLATGARPRCLGDLMGAGIHKLRTVEDARRLRSELVAGRRLAIVGAGFVGTEVASTAVALGLDVTIVDAGRLPFEPILGTEIGSLLADRYRAHGVDLRLETSVAGVRRSATGAIRALSLRDGTELASDLVLLAVGAEPAGELVRAPGGIETDGGGRTAFPDVYACGDVAAPWHPVLGRHLRLEHWTSAASQAGIVARAILDREPEAPPTPYFWSDQFGLRLQHVGLPRGWRRVVVEGDEESFAARYLARDGSVVAALLVNRPQDVAYYRRRLAPELLAA